MMRRATITSPFTRRTLLTLIVPFLILASLSTSESSSSSSNEPSSRHQHQDQRQPTQQPDANDDSSSAGEEEESSSSWTLSWNAPFLAPSSGYGSEATQFLLGLSYHRHRHHFDSSFADVDDDDDDGANTTATTTTTNDDSSCDDDRPAPRSTTNTRARRRRRRSWDVAVGFHGDVIDMNYAESLPTDVYDALVEAAHNQRRMLLNENAHAEASSSSSHKKVVVICHSEPGAWSVPQSLYDAGEPCPPSPPSWPLFPQRRPPYHKVIGRTMFETDRLPSGWPERLNAMDELWVPTAHHKKIFERDGVTKPVVVVGQGIDCTDTWNPIKTEPLPWSTIDPEGHCKEEDYKFLSVFKWEKRKGPDVLIPAFLEAFLQDVAETNENVVGGETKRRRRRMEVEGACLIVVTSLYHDDAQRVWEELDGYWPDALGGANDTEDEADVTATKPSSRRRRGIVLLSSLPNDALIRLYRTVDAFVLPSRGEGWGRPYMEAMSMGLPTIATNWSGPTEFVTEENGYLLPITGLVDAKLDAFPGHQWAEPNRTALVELMRYLKDHPDEGRAKGERARSDVVAKWDHRWVAQDVLRRLDYLAEEDDDGSGGGGSDSDDWETLPAATTPMSSTMRDGRSDRERGGGDEL